MDYKKLFRTYKEMGEVYSKVGKKRSSPYFYAISNFKQHLFFVGTKHTFNIDDSQFTRIKNLWIEFLTLTKGKNSIVFVEGGTGPIPNDIAKATQNYGENGFISYLAQQSHIEVYSPEPSANSEAHMLEEKFSKDEIMYMYFARTVAQWNRLTIKPDFEEYINKYLSRHKETLQWKNYDFSIAHFISIHNQRHKHHFDKDNYDCFHNDSTPSLNPISASLSTFRDGYHLSKILEFWNKGKNIFIVYGSGHAITMEPALKKLLIV